MKRNLIGILSLVVMSVMLNAPANAQTFAKADVPFAFKVGSAQLPAGTYRVNAAGDTAVVIQNLQTSASALSIGRHEYAHETSSKLVFHRVAGQYFLSEIWRGGSNAGIVIPTSDQEKNLRKELQRASGESKVGEELKIALN
jgi:hypothetical protein